MQDSTLAQTRASAKPPLEYIGSWGAKGNGPGQLDDPASIATDAIGNVYIADAGSLFIHKYDPLGTPLLAFQQDGLDDPQWITVDRGGAMYVSDPARGSVFIFFPNGERYRELRLRGRRSAENFVSAAVGDSGLIQILDSDAGKVFSYTPRRFQRAWLPVGCGRNPGPIVVAPDGSLYISDPANNRIERYTAEGRYVISIGPGIGKGPKLSRQFAVSNSGVFVMDADGRMLHVYTPENRVKHELDLAPELGQGSRPAPPLAISPHQELLVLDAPETRVLRYRINF
ncbi:MAG: NHL repeat-containing protein [Candidatus Acidiferrales bacterium]